MTLRGASISHDILLCKAVLRSCLLQKIPQFLALVVCHDRLNLSRQMNELSFYSSQGISHLLDERRDDFIDGIKMERLELGLMEEASVTTGRMAYLGSKEPSHVLLKSSLVHLTVEQFLARV